MCTKLKKAPPYGRGLNIRCTHEVSEQSYSWGGGQAHHCHTHYYIVACQQGGVSDEPSWLRAATRHGPRDPSNKALKFEKDGSTTGPVLLRQGEPGTSQYTASQYNVSCINLYIPWPSVTKSVTHGLAT